MNKRRIINSYDTCLVWLCFLSLLIGSATVNALTYCVDNVSGSGSDGNSGLCDDSSPWETLNAIEVFSASPGFLPGDKILFKRNGVYSSRSSIIFQNSGDAPTQSYIEFGDQLSNQLVQQ